MAIFYQISQPGKGTLGSNYLRRTRDSKGRTVNVLAQKNFTPHNPKTNSQMAQRARFSTAVKFYKRATKNFFKFAYEDQKPNESAFNAFMRHNVSAALAMNKFQVASEIYPAVGRPWLLSQGSLPSYIPVYDEDESAWALFPSSVGNTVSSFTAAVLSEQPSSYAIGDIITIVGISNLVELAGFGAYTAEDVAQYITTMDSPEPPAWCIAQFVLSNDDTTALTDIPFTGNYSPMENASTGGNGSFNLGEQFAAVAVVHTRRNGSSLLASNSYLVLSPTLLSIVNAINASGYYDSMLTSWGAVADDAILKGTVAGSGHTIGTVIMYQVSTVNGSAVPASLDAERGNQDVTLQIVGSGFNGSAEGSPLLRRQFSCTNCTIKSLTVDSDTQATLVVTITTGAYSIALNGTTIASGTTVGA